MNVGDRVQVPKYLFEDLEGKVTRIDGERIEVEILRSSRVTVETDKDSVTQLETKKPSPPGVPGLDP